MAVNPVIGCRDFVYAELLTDPAGGTPTFGTVYNIEAIKSFNYNSASSMSRAYGDNSVVAAAENVGDQSLTIDLNDIPMADKARLLGHTYVNGQLTQSKDDISPYFAVGAKIDLNDGSYIAVWFPKVKFMKPGQDAATKESSVSYQIQSLEGAILNLSANGNYRASIRTDDTSVPAGTITAWFNAPVFSSGADLGALNVVVAKNTTKARFTFTKTGGGNITLATDQLNTSNLPVYKGSNAAPIAGAYAITSGQGTATVVVDFTPTVAFGAVAVAGSVSPNGITDQNGVRATQTGAVWTSD